MPVINAQDYGFLPGNSGAMNREAWEAAITAAANQGQPLYIPAGTYALELSASQSADKTITETLRQALDAPERQDRAITVDDFERLAVDADAVVAPVKGVVLTQSVTILGDGPNQTVIDVYPKLMSFPFSVIWWDSPDLHVTVRGLKVLGPTGTTAAHPDQAPECALLHGNIAEPYGSDNRISVDDLVVTGKFERVIHTANGDGLVEVRNSDLTALSICVAVFESTNTFVNKRFHADNCRFASGIPATETSDGDPHGICVYLHPHIATRVTNCRFYDNPRDAIKQYGVCPIGNAPKYSQYIGCHFFNCAGVTILTPGEDVVTLIQGCSFDQGRIACRNKTTITGCEFRHGAGIGSTAGNREKQFEVNIVGCWVHVSTPGDALRDTRGMSLLVRDCLFSFADGCDDSTRGVSLGNAEYGEVSSCRFVSRTADTHATDGVKVSPQKESRVHHLGRPLS